MKKKIGLSFFSLTLKLSFKLICCTVKLLFMLCILHWSDTSIKEGQQSSINYGFFRIDSYSIMKSTKANEIVILIKNQLSSSESFRFKVSLLTSLALSFPIYEIGNLM